MFIFRFLFQPALLSCANQRTAPSNRGRAISLGLINPELNLRKTGTLVSSPQQHDLTLTVRLTLVHTLNDLSFHWRGVESVDRLRGSTEMHFPGENTMGQLQGTDAEHPASGCAAVRGQKLQFDGVTITEAPDAQVWLTKKFDKASGVNLGNLQSFEGDQSYLIPGDVGLSDYDSVVIWCNEFSVPIAEAAL
jgi:hypothetical protein